MSQVNAPLVRHQSCHIRLQDPCNVIEIKSFQSELEKHRVERLDAVLGFVTDVSRTLESLKADVFGSSSKRFDIEHLREKLLGMEEKIVGLKVGIKEELAKVVEDESTLLKDLKFFEKRVEDWEKPVNLRILKPAVKSSYKIPGKGATDPAAAFQKFLASFGGHTGGWLDHDHCLFLRERKKVREKEKFFVALQSLVPDLSYDEIVEHENWYQRYESLRNSQKEAIQKWKEEKSVRESNASQKVEPKKEKDKWGGKGVATNQVQIAERIKEWRKQQENKKLEEEERRKREEKELQAERNKMREMYKRKKEAVNRYRAEKARLLLDSNLQQEKKIDATDRMRQKILLESFRLQDVKYVEKKKIIRLQLESRSKSKVERLKITKSPFDFLLQRDPQRIFKPTIIWNEHCRPAEEKNKSNNVFNLNAIPRLAIPEWRRELK